MTTNFSTLIFGNKTYTVDDTVKALIADSKRSFSFLSHDDVYPGFVLNCRRISLMEFIYPKGYLYLFRNGDPTDLRRENVDKFHRYHGTVIEAYTVIEYVEGHFLDIGKYAHVMKNPIWRVNVNGKEHLLMYCERDILCTLCTESYQKILDFEMTRNNGKKLTFFKDENGYIMCTIHNIYIHHIIVDCHKKGRGTLSAVVSVEHIDQNPLNNTMANLRITTRKELQQQTTAIETGTKWAKYSNVKALPDGLDASMMRKYVHYCETRFDKGRSKVRTFFGITSHPKLDKPWTSTSSSKVPLIEKLAQANKVVDDLENDIFPQASARKLKQQQTSEIEDGTKRARETTTAIETGTKRAKYSNVKALPDGLDASMMRKYVHFYRERFDQEHRKARTFFRIISHPKLDKSWTSTSSSKVPLIEKLAQANKVVDDLENDIFPQASARKVKQQKTSEIEDGTKRARQTFTRALPDGIDASMIRKYVYFYKESCDEDHSEQRSFFRVESHPKLDKPWTSRKSSKVPLLKKLAEANKIVDDLENDFPAPTSTAISNEQNQMTTGIEFGAERARHPNMRALPEGLEQSMMRKYVRFYSEIYDKEHPKERTFFRVEFHPKLDYSWTSSKSAEVPLLEKLAQANKVVDDLENGIFPVIMPKHVSWRIGHRKAFLTYDRSIACKPRMTFKMSMPKECDLTDQLAKFKVQLTQKYPDVQQLF